MRTTTNNQIVAAFDAYRSRMDAQYDAARVALLAGEYDRCHTILAMHSVHHAQGAVSLRNLLVRQGLMKGDE